MSTTTTSITVTFGYSNTDATTKYKFSVDDPTLLNTVKAKALAINASIAGGTDGGLADFFRSEDFDDSDAENVVGKFSGIVALQSDSTEETVINLNN